MAGDGQVTMGDTIMKGTAVKIRTMSRGPVLAGFAGAVADALTLFDRFETQLERNGGNLRKSAVDLAKDWRTDRYLRRLEAQLVLADAETLLLIQRRRRDHRTRQRCHRDRIRGDIMPWRRHGIAQVYGDWMPQKSRARPWTLPRRSASIRTIRSRFKCGWH